MSSKKSTRGKKSCIEKRTGNAGENGTGSKNIGQVRGGSNMNSSSNNGSSNGSFYEEFLPGPVVDERLLNGTLFRGMLRVLPQKRRTAFVSVEGVKNDILIEGEKDRNRCIDGDEVVVQLLPESEWPEKPESAINAELTAEIARNGSSESRVDTTVKSNLWCPDASLMSAFGDKSAPLSELPRVGDAPAHAIDFACRPRTNASGEERSLQPRGKVVHVLRRAHKATAIGEIQLPPSCTAGARLPEKESRLFFHALDKRYPHILIQRNLLPDNFVADPFSYNNHIFAVDIVSGQSGWPVTSKFPAGDNLRSVGQAGSIQSETEALLIDNGLSSAVFDETVISSLREYIYGNSASLPPPPPSGSVSASASISEASSGSGWQIPPEEIERRLDLRSTCIFTIDPSGAKDLDDALHITQLGDDLFEIGVHIADVSYFVRPGTPVDDEASRRATSIYLVQKVIPMLPPILCEELCSLNPNVDRLAYSCIWKMRRDGTLLENSPPRLVKTVIRSCAKMDYITAQRIIEGKIPADCSDNAAEIPEELWEARRKPVGHPAAVVACNVRLFNEVAQNRRALRMGNGALVLNKTKLSFRLDMSGNPCTLSAYPIYDSNRLVEEYMLLANYLVAQEMLVRVGNFAFIRNHPPPELKSLDVLNGIAGMLGVTMDTSSSAGMQDSLSRLTAARGTDAATLQAITALLMKPMQLAQYIVAGKVLSDDWRHFALCIPYYTHFTSPIRRYADVMVHRLLHEGVGGDVSDCVAAPLLLERYHSVAEHCNKMKKASKDAQERSDVVFFAVYLMAQPGGAVVTDGVVIGLGEKTFTVLVSDAYGGSQARMFVDEMEGVTCSYDKGSKTLVLLKEGGASSGVSEGRNRARGSGSCGGRGCELAFTSMSIQLMSRVRVRLSAKESVPIDIRVALVGPA